MASEWQKFLDVVGLDDPHETGRPWVSAHRGYSGAAPENTLAAVDSARAVGVEFIEFDVTRSSDGVPVVIHDDTLDRTSNGTGTVEGKTAAELAAIDTGSWLGPGFAGARIPTLVDMLASFTRHGGRMLFEFKGFWEPDGARLVCDMVRDAGLAGSVLVQSFNAKTVRNLLQVAPDLPRGLLRSAPRSSDVNLLPELGAAAYNPSVQGLLYKPDVMRRILATGVGSFVWFVDEQDQWRQLLDFGVSSIITDHPARLQGYLDAVLGVADHPAPPRSVPYRLPEKLPD